MATLLDQLGRAEDLPEGIRSLVAQATKATAKQEAKALHRLVAQRSEAFNNLERIRGDRATYEAAWANYAQHLLDTLTEQLNTRDETLKTFTQSEDEWSQRLREASLSLKTATVGQGRLLGRWTSMPWAPRWTRISRTRSTQMRKGMPRRRFEGKSPTVSADLCWKHCRLFEPQPSFGAERRDASRSPRRKQTVIDLEKDPAVKEGDAKGDAKSDAKDATKGPAEAYVGEPSKPSQPFP